MRERSEEEISWVHYTHAPLTGADLTAVSFSHSGESLQGQELHVRALRRKGYRCFCRGRWFKGKCNGKEQQELTVIENGMLL